MSVHYIPFHGTDLTKAAQEAGHPPRLCILAHIIPPPSELKTMLPHAMRDDHDSQFLFMQPYLGPNCKKEKKKKIKRKNYIYTHSFTRTHLHAT